MLQGWRPRGGTGHQASQIGRPLRDVYRSQVSGSPVRAGLRHLLDEATFPGSHPIGVCEQGHDVEVGIYLLCGGEALEQRAWEGISHVIQLL